MSPDGSEMENADPSTSVTAPPSIGVLALVVHGCGITPL